MIDDQVIKLHRIWATVLVLLSFIFMTAVIRGCESEERLRIEKIKAGVLYGPHVVKVKGGQ